MKKALFLLVSVMLASPICFAEYGVCSDKGWSKMNRYDEVSRKKFNASIEFYNKLLEHRYEVTFLHEKYQPHDIAGGWGSESAQFIKTMREVNAHAQKHIQQVKAENKKLDAISKRYSNSREAWQLIADDCFDGDEMDNHFTATRNMNEAIAKRDRVSRLQSKLTKISDKFNKEIELISSSRKLYFDALKKPE